MREVAAADSARQAPTAPGPDAPDSTAAAGAGREGGVVEAQVDWRLPAETLEVRRLNAWCAAVGPAVLGGWAEPTAGEAEVDTLRVVSWNAHAGGGHLRELVEDLRAGRLTGGGPVEHFVLLIQEAYREGEAVPGYDPGLPGGSAVDAAPVGRDREDIVRDAEALGLSLFYAPSMRSGTGEDRGNAILATLPLTDPVAIELPVARQRRVAVGATVSARTADGRPWQVQVASVHLENDAAGWVRDEEARRDQGEALLAALPEARAAIAG
ncbi:MAG: hypothetical protein GWM90_12135, partial [Gemmatimonadetes bacterium]|nr:hypothetical protein [Gemmatimonadota bacterium]NIQ54755.1 hypothetical protein [Gemmatimonadota bacterium]NIU74964.1 hypothetical protein [Gammaproteobacteria bacterium]NIX44837.1 hypothetical protein [Gemmatimonadota bacterium]NIY09075.1 hypothetical protein [Gemmatimonadota bacterium]